MKETKASAGGEEQPCSWCQGGGDLDVGPGIFRDFDSDLGDGIPVCGGCGGIGRQINSPNFRKQAENIMKLRFAYHKARGLDRLSILKTLVEKVEKHFRLYGREDDKSFAARISRGALDDVLTVLRAQFN